MALTERERNLLDNLMERKIEECIKEKKEYFTLEEFVKYLEENKFPATVTYRNITPCLQRMPYRLRDFNNLNYSDKKIIINHYSYVIDRSFNFIKEKNLLYLNAEKTLYYDFITKKFNVPFTKIKTVGWCNYSAKSYQDIFKYEWLFNYCDSINTVKRIIENSNYNKIDISTMPSGLYKYLTENSLQLDFNILKEYVNKLKYGKYCKFVESICVDSIIIDSYLKNEKIESLIKMANLSVLNGKNPFALLYNFMELYDEVFEKYNEVNIDTNRDLNYNITLLEDIKNRERNEKLASQLQKLNFIHNMQFGDYVVVVPQNQADKQAEGKMQNNCVGHYYDDSIIKGENLIYFIRKTCSPNKSYITCRYKIPSRNTTEARKVNNESINNPKETELIKKITNIINENLK